MNKKLLATLCACSLTVTIGACSSASSSSNTTEAVVSSASSVSETSVSANSTDLSNIALGISFGQNVHPFFKAMQKGAQDAANKHGVKLVVQSADSSVEKQSTQIENLAQSGVKAILVNPYDSAAVAPAISEALNKKIGIFTMDITVIGAKATSFIASDNVKIGTMLGEYIDKRLGGKGKVALLDDPSVTSLKDRETGLTTYLKDHTQIKIVAKQTGAIERTKSLNAAEDILQANPDINAFIGINENSALGIVSAIKSAGLQTKGIIVTGVDSTEDVMNGIKDGSIAIGVAQDPYQMGYQSVDNAIKWIKGESISNEIKLDCEYMTKDNIDKFFQREAAYNAKK
jgi:ribose transport system substrate-binding protein